MGTTVCSERDIPLKSSSAVLLLGLSLLAALATGQTALCQTNGHGVSVLSLAPAVLAADPGQILSLSFSITSKSQTEEEFVEALGVPEGWQSVIPMGTYRLAPGATRVRIVAVAVPRTAVAGDYTITYGVRSQRDYAILDSASVTTRVGAVSKLEFLTENQPDVVLAGDPFTATTRLMNRGNVPATLHITASVESHYKVKLVPDTLALKPGASGAVEVQVQSDPNETRAKNLAIALAATPAGQTGETLGTAYLVVNVDIVPRHSQAPDLYQRLPVAVSTTITGRGGHAGVQVEASGAGFLDEDHTKSLDFLVRQPDQQAASSLGQRDEIWAKYAQPHWAVGAGDLYYGLSYLTEQTRYGRGLQIDLRPPGPWSCKAYYLQSRWEDPAVTEAGAAVAYCFPGGQLAQLNFLSKSQDQALRTAAEQAEVYSLVLSTPPDARHQFSVEAAGSNQNGGPAGTAYRITAAGPIGPHTTYSFEKDHAGPDYQGAFQHADYLQLGLGSQLGRRLNASISYSNWQTNLAQRAVNGGGAPHEQLFETGLTYQLSRQWYVSGAWQSFTRRDLMQPETFDDHETVQRFSLGYSGSRFTGRLDADRTCTNDRLADLTTNAEDYTLYAGYQAATNLTLSGYTSWAKNDSRSFSYLLGTSGSSGLSANWRPRPDFNLDLSYVHYSADSAGQQSDQINGTIGYQIDDHRRLDLEVRCDAPFNGGQQDMLASQGTQYLVKYTRLFNVATARKTNVGQLRGRVYDARQAGKPGLGNIIVTCSGPGVAAATNADGTFSLGGLKPGMYLVQLSRTSLGPTRTTELKMPLTVEVKAGQVNSVEIGVCGAARVSGTVHIDRPAAQTGDSAVIQGPQANVISGAGVGSHPQGPLADMTVELSHDGEVLRSLTDAQGGFVFDGLRPGNYHLTVYADNLPEHYHLEKPEQDLDLTANADVKVDVRVLPETRRIKMIDEGSIPSGPPGLQAAVAR